MAACERLICAASELAEGGKGVRFELKRLGEARAGFRGALSREPRSPSSTSCAHVPVELDWQRRRVLRRLAAILDLRHPRRALRSGERAVRAAGAAPGAA